ncbi:MAG TPA: Rne/Rng family ribonuclease [Bryobacteraceae bacterium]|jgi:ribonuclease G|nr:Rne/Rng family ribonuclease [Bryobacteraceae bacterium]
MSKELVIGSNRHETKVAILEDDQLVEVFFQRGNEYSLAGSIHKGRVTRVLPGMQSAFVDLGLERDTFLYVSDFFEENDDIDTVTDEKPPGRRDRPDRDRGDRERGDRERTQLRAVEARPASTLEVVEPIGEEPAAVSEPEDEPEENGSANGALAGANGGAGGVASSPVSLFEAHGPETQRTDARSEGDRGGRGGDRRGRRSRRRRSRGHGFPENKYAQPGQIEQRREPVEALRLPVEANAIAEVESDVIILPGESLAKYRHLTPAGDESSDREEPEVDGEDAEREIHEVENAIAEAVAHDEELTAEAEEIELADRILSHRGASVLEEEETLAEVKREPHVSPFVVSDLDEDEEEADKVTPAFTAEPDQVTKIDEGPDKIAPAFTGKPEQVPEFDEGPDKVTPAFTGEPQQVPEFDEGPDKITPAFTATPKPLTETNVVELPPPAVEPGAETYTPSEIPAESEHPERIETEDGLSAGERAEDELAEEAEEIDVVEFAAPGESFLPEEESKTPGLEDVALGTSPETEPRPGQSATVREQGDRYLHRVGGRRMRRRRGGNRGGPQNFGERAPQESNQDVLPEPRGLGNVGSEGRFSGAGAAIAVEGRTEQKPELRRETVEERSTEAPERAMPSISELLKAGQEIIVQIAKEPLGQKGARITSHVALPGRYVVFMPSVTHLGVSRKIASDEERQRLKRILQAHREGTTGGFIVRTAGEGVPEEEIAADMDFLYKLWLDIRQKAEKRPAPMLLHCDLDVVQRILRDQVTEEFKSIWVDNEDMYENVLSFMQRFQPALVNRVKMYTRSAPIFDAFGITPELEKALRPKVWLKSGGYIVINQTEALVAIDINTGKYVGKSNRLEDTIVKTNIEAVKEIVRQIRLRDLGGIIVVDFIDMDERKNRQKVMQALEDAMRVDKAPYKILQFNDFGLVAITRKRVKQSLERALCSPCPYCEGAGYVKSVQTVIGEILTEAQKLAKAIEGQDVLLRVHPDVAKVLKANDNRYLEEIEEILARPVLVKSDPTLHMEKFDLG